MFYYRYYGLTCDGIPGGLGIFGYEKYIKYRGVFNNGKLNGIGRSELENGDIYDGIFLSGDLNIGFIYLKNEQRYLYANFENGVAKKKLKEGKGFPYYLLSACKHNIYMTNLSYYYRYTALEAVYLNDHDRKLFLIHPICKRPKQTNNKKNCFNANANTNANANIYDNHLDNNNNDTNSTFNNNNNNKLKTVDKRQECLKNSLSPIKIIENKTKSENPNNLLENGESDHQEPNKQENAGSFHRKSISLEKSKYSEYLPESPPKDGVKKCTFNDDTPKKVALPKENHNDLIKTNKHSSNDDVMGINDALHEKKPTNLEYSAFIKSEQYYQGKINEIINKFDNNDEIQDDEENPAGKINIFHNQKRMEGPPSFGENSDKHENLIQNYKIDQADPNDFKNEQKVRSSVQNIQKYAGNQRYEEENGNKYKGMAGFGNKNALVIYYDYREGENDDREVDIKDFECKYYNLFNKRIERPLQNEGKLSKSDFNY